MGDVCMCQWLGLSGVIFKKVGKVNCNGYFRRKRSLHILTKKIPLPSPCYRGEKRKKKKKNRERKRNKKKTNLVTMGILKKKEKEKVGTRQTIVLKAKLCVKNLARLKNCIFNLRYFQESSKVKWGAR